jgi:hypothetical protein
VPKYFFHIEGSIEYIDTVGTELAGVELMRRTATRTAAEILRDDDRLWEGKLWRMRVTDEADNAVMVLEFRASLIEGLV